MAENRSWLVFAKKESCRHAMALNQMGYLCWNPHHCKFQVGDTVYMFMSTDRHIRFKTVVTEINVPRTDQKYWLIPTSNSLVSKLEFVEYYDGKDLDEFSLMEYGFKGTKSLQQAKQLDGVLLNYIESKFTK